MKKITYKLLSLISSSLTYLFIVTSVYAASAKPVLKDPSGIDASKVKVENIPQLVINLIFALAGFLAVVYLMYGGIRYMTSRGDKMAVEDARKHIVSAVIGLVVVIGTFVIIQFVFTLLGADNPLSNGFKVLTLPELNK